jgi:hypothetical protein
VTNEELVRRYSEASMNFDFSTLDELRHPEWSAVWPQSGEVLRGSANHRAVVEHYPGGRPQVVQEQLVGSEDRWATTPLGGAYRVAGEGEFWTGVWRQVYPDGRTYFSIVLIELRDSKIYRETIYWAEPFEAPAWRAPWVERA